MIAALYHFTRLDDPDSMALTVKKRLGDSGIVGTIIVAFEGINGTISGCEDSIVATLDWLRQRPGLGDLNAKLSHAPELPFKRLKVRVKPEIVTFGQPNCDPSHAVGTYVEPHDWNALIARDDVVVLDTRNSYETAIGTFRGAVDPDTSSFREFPDWWGRNAGALKDRSIAMFCTGGIRCEKASSWLLSQGVSDVFHLKGGILKYLEDVPKEESLWDGSCFVFDDRVSVDHGLEVGPHTLCHACRRALEPADRDHPTFREGISCPHCIDEKSDADRRRYSDRQRQIELARKSDTAKN